MLEDKESIPDIAQELDRSIYSVNKKIYVLKIGNGRTGIPRNLQRAAFILNRLIGGLSITTIGRLLGVGCNAILKSIRWMKEDGLVVKVGRRYQVTKKWYQPTEGKRKYIDGKHVKLPDGLDPDY